jgi:hypothetical protein
MSNVQLTRKRLSFGADKQKLRVCFRIVESRPARVPAAFPPLFPDRSWRARGSAAVRGHVVRQRGMDETMDAVRELHYL